MTPWYVCQTKPRQEALAVRKLEEQRYEVYLPMLTTWQKMKQGWRRNEQVMFPRYGFVRCAHPEQSIAPIRSTPGVTSLVTFGNIPATIDNTLVESIRQLAKRYDSPEHDTAAPFKVGENVEITDGPLKGLSGIVSTVAQERVVVLLTLLGREKPVAIPLNQLSSSTKT